MQSSNQIENLEQSLAKERQARIEAEKRLEQKTRELNALKHGLEETNSELKESLYRKKSELDGVFENIIDAYVIIEISGNVLKMNEAAVELLGYDVKVEKINLLDLVKEDYLEYTKKAFRKLFKTGSYTNYRAVIINKDQKEKIVQINASLIYDKEGKPVAAQGIARDITREERMKEIMEKQRKELDIIFKNSKIGITLSDPQLNRILLVNRAMCNILGYTEEELTTLGVKAITAPEDMPESMRLMKKLYSGEIDSFTVEKRYLKKDGDTVWARTSVTAVRDKEGNLEYQVGTTEDISDEKLASDRLKASEDRMATLISNLQTGILLEDENRKIQLTNQKFCEFFKIPAKPEELVGVDCKQASIESAELFEDPESFVNDIEAMVSCKHRVIGEELRMRDGKIMERNYIPIMQGGVCRGHLWSYDDFTLQKRYKENLQAQKEKYSNIIANMKLGLLEVDNEDRIIMANQSFTELSGYSENELIGKPAAKFLLLEEYQKVITEKNKERTIGKSDSYEVKMRKKSGELRTWLISGAPNFDMNGNVTGSIGIHLDITEQKQMERKQKELLKDLEKQNQQLNDYAHIVSHDLKSPLRNISALISWTKEDFKEKLEPRSLTNLDLMQAKVEKMDHLIENILKYSSLDSSIVITEIVDLQQLVEEIISLIYIPDHIDVRVIKELPVIEADPTRIQQVFQNLISNAVNYIDKEKGIVEIDVSETDEKYIFSIMDNGCGIAKKHHKDIFKIFSSVNSSSATSGIGLSIVQKIIERYKGEIWLESEPGKGTTFYFSLNKPK